MNNSNPYSIVVFFQRRNPLKWKYVNNLKKTANDLSRLHPTWKYMNVYDRKSGNYLKRFYPENNIPKAIK